MLRRREQLSCQMLGKCVWDVSNDSHMNGRADKLLRFYFGVCALLCWLKWHCVLCESMTLWGAFMRCEPRPGKKQEAGDQGQAWESDWRTSGRWKSRAVCCRHSFVITHLWRRRPDILSANVWSCWLLPLIPALSVKSVFPNTEARRSLNRLLYLRLKSKNSLFLQWDVRFHSCSALPSSFANINLRNLP